MLRNKSDVRALALSIGIVWGFSIFIITIISYYTSYATEFLLIIKSIYPGYQVTIPGSFIGLIYGFLDGFIGIYLIFILYNIIKKLSRRC